MASETLAWEKPVDERVELIAKSLDNNDFAEKVPGLKSLLDDYLEAQVDRESFLRRLLAVFKDSQADFAYEDLLKLHTEDERHRIEDFVAGKSPGEICDGFTMQPSLGVRDEVHQLLKAQVYSISAAGPALLESAKEGVSKLEALQHKFHDLLHNFADLFHQHEDKSEVQVSSSKRQYVECALTRLIKDI